MLVKYFLVLTVLNINYKTIKMKNNCVKLSTDNEIFYWGGNSTDFLLKVQPNMFPPIITYSERYIKEGNISVLHYEWCGPMMLIIKEFAKSVRAKYLFLLYLEN